jgi:hypothetical protein
MKTDEKVLGPASYFPSIEKTYGEPIAHWFNVVKAAGPLKHMELVRILKTEHKMGHGHANAIVAYLLAKKSDLSERSAERREGTPKRRP